MKRCEFCTLPLLGGSNRAAMHSGCLNRAERLAKWRKDLKLARKLADRKRHRVRLTPVSQLPKKLKRLADQPVSMDCELCARTHHSRDEVAMCHERYERSTNDVRAWR